MSIACNRLENNKQCATWRCRATPITGPNRDLRNKFARTEMKRNDLQKNSTHRAKEKTLQAQKKGIKKSELVKVNNRWFAMWTIAIVILVLCVGFFLILFLAWLCFFLVCGSCFYLCERIHQIIMAMIMMAANVWVCVRNIHAFCRAHTHKKRNWTITHRRRLYVCCTHSSWFIIVVLLCLTVIDKTRIRDISCKIPKPKSVIFWTFLLISQQSGYSERRFDPRSSSSAPLITELRSNRCLWINV